jgi:hypothetical protein
MSYDQRLVIETVLRLLTDVIAIGAAVLLFRRRPRDPVAASLSLAFLCLSATIGSGFYSFRVLGLNDGWTDLFLLLGASGFAALFLGISTFPQGRFEPRWSAVIALLVIPWSAYSITMNVLDLPTPRAHSLFGMGLMAASIAAVAARSRRVISGTERQQIRWAMLGFAIGAVIYSVGFMISSYMSEIDGGQDTVDSGTEPETIGWILLGPRPDGSFYGKDEQEALAEIADPVARSIHVARQRAEREAHTEFRLSGLESALARLAANLTAKRTDPLSQPDG